MTQQQWYRITWRWFFAFAVISFIVNFSYNGVRCLQEKIPSCDSKLQETANLRYQNLMALKNSSKIQQKKEEDFWLTITSLHENEVVVDVD
jgi:hypothetical protein